MEVFQLWLFHLQDFYIELRRKHHSSDSTPITTRQLESLVRLTEAKAKIELREEATQQDALDIIEIMKYRLNLHSLLLVCVCIISTSIGSNSRRWFTNYQFVVKLCSSLLLLWLCWFLSYVQSVPTWQHEVEKKDTFRKVEAVNLNLFCS